MIAAIRDTAAAWILAVALIGGIIVYALLRDSADPSPGLRRVDVSVRGAAVDLPEGARLEEGEDPATFDPPPNYYTLQELFMERLE